MKTGKESAYDWAVMPEDLPRKNLVLITAKTPHPTFHKEDKDFPVRLFTTEELHEAARSLAHRPIGLNHMGIIEKAFTVDSQFNKSTDNVEALCYFPDEWIGKVRTLLSEGKESIFSVNYTWRNEKYVPEGVHFLGLIFDGVDLLCGLNAGDKFTSAQLVESAINLSHRRSCVESIGVELVQQELISDTVKQGSEADKPIKNPSTGPQMPSRKEGEEDMPEKTNLLNNSPQSPIHNQDPPHTTEPIVNVASAGFVQDEKGFVGTEPSDSKPPVTLVGIESNPVIDGLNNVLGPNVSNSSYIKVESEKDMEKKEEPKPEEKKNETLPKEETKKEPEKQPEKKPEVSTGPDTKLVEAEKKLSESLVTIEALDKRVKELEPVVNKLQDAAKTFDSDKVKAKAEGFKEGKKAVIKNISSVLPSTSFVSGNLQGAYRVLVNDVKKKLYESENSK